MIKYFLYLLILLSLFFTSAFADESAEDGEGVKPTQTNPEQYSAIKEWMNEKYLTGEWQGLRNHLEENGISLNVSYTNDSLIKMRGGFNNKVYLRPISLLNFSVTIDTEKFKLPGGKIYVLGQNVHGEGLTQNFVGSFQKVSSIEAEPLTQLGEFWYEQKLLKDKIRTKIGKQDANTEFCLLHSNASFLNESFSSIPNVLIPSYPNQSFGTVAIVEPVKWFDAKAGFYGGQSNSRGVGVNSFFNGRFVTVAEIGLNPTIKNRSGNYIFGYWFSSANTEGVGNNRTFGSNTGFYTAFEQMIFKENEEKKDNQGLSIQGQFGWAPSDRNVIGQYYGASMVYRGLIPHRDDDISGIGAAIAGISRELKESENLKNETVLELFYKAQLTPFFAVQPDMQFIFNPGGNKPNAFVMGIRTIINF